MFICDCCDHYLDGDEIEYFERKDSVDLICINCAVDKLTDKERQELIDYENNT